MGENSISHYHVPFEHLIHDTPLFLLRKRILFQGVSLPIKYHRFTGSQGRVQKNQAKPLTNSSESDTIGCNVIAKQQSFLWECEMKTLLSTLVLTTILVAGCGDAQSTQQAIRAFGQGIENQRRDALREAQIDYYTRPYNIGLGDGPGIWVIPRRR